MSVIDLFSGCGGMSLGFQRAGFDIVGGVESDAQASQTYAKNLFKTRSTEEIEKHSIPREINKYLPNDFSRDFLEPGGLEDQIDVIIGGPPCQAFARIGRAKLRQIMDHKQAHLNDHRADLYTHFLMYVEAFQPRAVVMENVPEILNFGGKNVGEEIAVSLRDIGYRVGYTLLNAAHFGVPQTRVRFFLIAYRENLGVNPSFPYPTHYSETTNNMYRFPANGNLEVMRDHQTSFLDQVESVRFRGYTGLVEPDCMLPAAVTTRKALGDLPCICSRELSPGEARSFSIFRSYRRGRPSKYASEMRNWVGYEALDGVSDHAIRFLPRDHEIFRRMKHGDQYPAAHEIALEVFREEKHRREQSEGQRIQHGSDEYQELSNKLVPPYPTDKFPNKWQKLDPNKPSHTLTAHLGKDCYSHIHYDSNQARVISVREAARLQSFPDGFEFPITLSHSLTQIGNAVPPLLAYQIARKMRAALKRND